jgi:hypothetical protein
MTMQDLQNLILLLKIPLGINNFAKKFGPRSLEKVRQPWLVF